MTTLVKIVDLLLDYFKGDSAKVALWLDTENPLLGGVRPIEMLKNGREEKLWGFIEAASYGYRP